MPLYDISSWRVTADSDDCCCCPRLLIIDNFIPPEEKNKITNRAQFDEDEDSWKLMPLTKNK